MVILTVFGIKLFTMIILTVESIYLIHITPLILIIVNHS